MAVDGRVGSLRDRGTGELVKQLSGQVSTLVRQEVELARLEMMEKGKQAAAGTGFLAGAAVAGLLMLGSLTAFLIVVLAHAIPDWAAALIVTGLWTGVAGMLAVLGRDRLRAMGGPVPEMTVETVKEDVEWLRNRR